jgi:hypothetical protein
LAIAHVLLVIILVNHAAHMKRLLCVVVQQNVLELSDDASQQSEDEDFSPTPSLPGSPETPDGGWHGTPVWPDITTFSQHTLRHLSRLSNVTLTEQAVSSLASPRDSDLVLP